MSSDNPAIPIGLCDGCRHVRLLRSARGSCFVLCQLPPPRPDWPKYPRLPVLQCEHYAPARTGQ